MIYVAGSQYSTTLYGVTRHELSLEKTNKVPRANIFILDLRRSKRILSENAISIFQRFLSNV